MVQGIYLHVVVGIWAILLDFIRPEFGKMYDQSLAANKNAGKVPALII